MSMSKGRAHSLDSNVKRLSFENNLILLVTLDVFKGLHLE